MAKNKIIYGNETLIDLTDDTVSPENLLSGATAHDRSGEQIQGTVVIPTVNDSEITIQKNGTDVDNFSLNQDSDKTINITLDKSDVGLDNVPNVSTNNQIPTFTEASTRANIASGEKLSVILGKIKKFFTDLKTVAFSGSYDDLSDKPTIPTVNNGKLTLNIENGSALESYQFTANQKGNTTVPISIPIPVNTVTSFNTQETNFSISLAAGGEKSFTPTITLSGWTPIGVIGIYTGNSNVNCIYFKLNNSSQARVDLKNLSNAAVSGTARVQILYYKNTNT